METEATLWTGDRLVLLFCFCFRSDLVHVDATDDDVIDLLSGASLDQVLDPEDSMCRGPRLKAPSWQRRIVVVDQQGSPRD